MIGSIRSHTLCREFRKIQNAAKRLIRQREHDYDSRKTRKARLETPVKWFIQHKGILIPAKFA
jgi:hypothetical protein